MVGRQASSVPQREDLLGPATGRSVSLLEPSIAVAASAAIGCGVMGLALPAALAGLVATGLAWGRFRHAMSKTNETLAALQRRDWITAGRMARVSGVTDLDLAVATVAEAAEMRDRALQEAIHRERMRALDLELRTGQLEDAHNRLEHANKDLEAFTYSASHDLGTPARTIASFASILLDELDLDGDELEYLKSIKTTSERMQALIEDLLVISRLRNPDEGAVRTISLAEVVGEVAADLRSEMTPSSRIAVEGALPEATVPGERVRQVLQNLIRNGLKFNDSEQPRVVVNGWGEGDMVVLRVTDNGIGIPGHDYEEVFGLFRRLHGASRFEGTGAGLAIARRAARSLGGELWVEQSSAEGTTFAFAFPSFYRPDIPNSGLA